MQQEKVFSVKELNNRIKNLLASGFPNILLEGEISEIKFHNTGNVYLKLKDDEAIIDAVIFNNNFREEHLELKEGTKVMARGAVSLNVKGGKYSFNIREISKKGQGELFEKFLKLKEKLEKAGLFDKERKKEIPFMPLKVGLVTSPDGAAVKDILTVSKRRFPSVDIIIFPAKVQGDDAPETVVRAIKAAEVYKNLDVLIIGRGGGAYDELAVFNDESIAYAIYNCPIPTVSAVGHERDVTIADFVADRRAATPSQAAEMVFPDRKELLAQVNYASKRMEILFDHKITHYRRDLEDLHPEMMAERMMDKIQAYYTDLDYYKDKLDRKITDKTSAFRNRLDLLFQVLEKLNPLYLLNRNYSILKDENGRVIKSVNDAAVGRRVFSRLKDGEIESVVSSKTEINLENPSAE